MTDTTIYHNPQCGTSRNTLALLRHCGIKPTIIEYLKTPPSRTELQGLIERMGVSVREVLRQKDTPYDALDLGNLCRPSERVLDLLPQPLPSPFTKEYGEVVYDPRSRLADLPQVAAEHFQVPDTARLRPVQPSTHAPRFLLLYGSLRARSFSRLLVQETARLLQAMGAEVKIFNPSGLPLPDDAPETHPKVAELRALAQWAEGMVWCSPERHGAMTGIMKAQIDWIPLTQGAIRPTQGKTLALMQVCGGSQSFNAVNQMRVLGRWMRMLTIPNQSSVAKAFQQFDEHDRMLPSSYHDRVVDVLEELVKFTLLTRDVAPYLVERYSERKESAEALMRRVNLTQAV